MPLVIGTAGHIDHGKTSLIKALTGSHCDRLAEEKKRGITIELGFAEYTPQNGEPISIIDVPGHEKFVHTMVSGASGIDFVLLIIAADEGIMPQTKEHLEICTLLGITKGAVVLTKTDLVDAELFELAKDDISSGLQGSFLENAPVFPVSTLTNEGLVELTAFLDSLNATLLTKRRSDLFRLPIDRVFSMKGHGTVVTGTIISGTTHSGDEIMLYPKEILTKVRNLEHHGAGTQQAPAGRRTAINLHGLTVEDIERGSVLAYPKTLFPSRRFITQITCLPSSPKPLKQRTTVHFHYLTKSVQAQLYFPYTDQLKPAETAFCEVRLEEPITAVYADRCVIRSFSPLRTVAGGVVIHPLGVAFGKKAEERQIMQNILETLAQPFVPNNTRQTAQKENQIPHGNEKATKEKTSSEKYATEKMGLKKTTKNSASKENSQESALFSEELLCASIASTGIQGATFAEIAILTDLGGKQLDKLLGVLGAKQQVFCADKEERRYISITALAYFSTSCLAHIAKHHEKNPLKSGPTRQELISTWGKNLEVKTAQFIIERLLTQKELERTNDYVHLPNHKPHLQLEEQNLRKNIFTAHEKGGHTPPNMKDVLEILGVDLKKALPLIKIMQDEKELVKVADGLWYETNALLDIRGKVIDWFATHENIDLADLKEITGLSRKYLVALLEYFDSIRFTVRVGDVRILRNKEAL